MRWLFLNSSCQNDPQNFPVFQMSGHLQPKESGESGMFFRAPQHIGDPHHSKNVFATCLTAELIIWIELTLVVSQFATIFNKYDYFLNECIQYPSLLPRHYPMYDPTRMFPGPALALVGAGHTLNTSAYSQIVSRCTLIIKGRFLDLNWPVKLVWTDRFA